MPIAAPATMRRKTPNPRTEESCPVVLLVLHVWSVCDLWNPSPFLHWHVCFGLLLTSVKSLCPTTALPLERCCQSKDGPAEVIPGCEFGKLTVRYLRLELQTKSATGRCLKSRHQVGSDRLCRKVQAGAGCINGPQRKRHHETAAQATERAEEQWLQAHA